VTPQRTGEGVSGTQSAEPTVAAIRAAVIRLWKRPGGARSSSRLRDAGWEQRLDTLAARVEHLETELEGLQDAVYRQAVLERESIGELRRRTEPEQLARDLGQDARRRGL
jgi:Mg2+ and Co2+ transporter CorA